MSAIAGDTLPGETVTAGALIDQAVWSNAGRHITGHLNTPLSPAGGSPVNVDMLAYQALEETKRDGSRKVGERHLIRAFVALGRNDFHTIQLNPDLLVTTVEALELGPAFLAAEIEGRWHGLVDTNAVIHYRDLWSIDWRVETGQSRVTIWATTTLLDELDELAFEAGPRSRARRRARAFNSWLRPKLRESMQPAGFEMRPDTRLRVWVPPLAIRAPDGQHLDAAEALLDRGVPIHVVSNDQGLNARAIARDLDIFQLPETALLQDQEGE
jgi:hypothetical protein